MGALLKYKNYKSFLQLHQRQQESKTTQAGEEILSEDDNETL